MFGLRAEEGKEREGFRGSKLAIPLYNFFFNLIKGKEELTLMLRNSLKPHFSWPPKFGVPGERDNLQKNL